MDMAGAVSGRKATLDDLCKPCVRAGTRVVAKSLCEQCDERLCDSCVVFHQSSRATRDHTITRNMLNHNPRQEEGNGQAEKDIMCQKHFGKPIEFYCAGHKRVFCYVCSAVEHRETVCKVNYIPEISDRYLEGIDCSSRIHRIDTFLNNCLATQRQASNSLNQFQDSLTEALRQIETFRNDINTTLDNWEGDLKDSLDKKRRSSFVLSPTNLERFSELKEELEQLQTRIIQQRSAQNTDRLFIELIQAESVLEENEKAITNFNNPGLNVVRFRKNERIESMLRSEVGLGVLEASPVSRSRTDSGASSMSNDSRAIARKDVNVKMRIEKRTSWITSIVALPGQKLVVADYNNHSIKLVDVVTDKVISRAILTSGPWEMTALPNNTLVVSLFDEEALEFLCISENKVKSLRKVQTGGRCQGVAYCEKGIVVTFITPPKFHIYDVNGRVFFASPEMNKLRGMFHISITRDNQYIVVGNDDTNSILKLDFTGKVCAEYKDLSINSPRGLDCHEDGSIFVCSKKDNSVLRVSADMKQRTVVMRREESSTVIKNPYAVFYEQTNALLYLSCASGKSKYDNFVKIFQMDELVNGQFTTSF